MTGELTPDWISLSEQATVDSKAPGQSKLVAGSFQRGRFQVGIKNQLILFNPSRPCHNVAFYLQYFILFTFLIILLQSKCS